MDQVVGEAPIGVAEEKANVSHLETLAVLFAIMYGVSFYVGGWKKRLSPSFLVCGNRPTGVGNEEVSMDKDQVKDLAWLYKQLESADVNLPWERVRTPWAEKAANVYRGQQPLRGVLRSERCGAD